MFDARSWILASLLAWGAASMDDRMFTTRMLRGQSEAEASLAKGKTIIGDVTEVYVVIIVLLLVVIVQLVAKTKFLDDKLKCVEREGAIERIVFKERTIVKEVSVEKIIEVPAEKIIVEQVIVEKIIEVPVERVIVREVVVEKLVNVYTESEQAEHLNLDMSAITTSAAGTDTATSPATIPRTLRPVPALEEDLHEANGGYSGYYSPQVSAQKIADAHSAISNLSSEDLMSIVEQKRLQPWDYLDSPTLGSPCSVPLSPARQPTNSRYPIYPPTPPMHLPRPFTPLSPTTVPPSPARLTLP
eukprot:gnl/MRDRNA2_/MRDRNA2_90224_c0_seq1.p1 gnl/MRDRNA2_/MRDRNA2_90224_c0~~gnl/MRDRNA2_/MRDRNA2_90224_c0_seq1.p1  ORF type:complete len:301 (+),score=47.49 gnl/MRDRNA2_/MRDRNA2_90224_c0_seq1:121-1023(+)